jgi:hypothetical protein
MTGEEGVMIDMLTTNNTLLLDAVIGRSPGDWPDNLTTAALRALRTLLQGIAAAFPAAGAGIVILQTTYWDTFGFSCLAALVAALVSFIQNVAGFLPEDPTQRS